MPKTRSLMIASALFLLLSSLAVAFAPAQLLALVGLSAEPPLPAFLMVMGGLYLGFAFLNWMAKGNMIGGIYSRPVAVGNFLHFLVGALTLLKQQITSEVHWILLAVLGLFVLFAALFGWLLFGKGPVCAVADAGQSAGREG